MTQIAPPAIFGNRHRTYVSYASVVLGHRAPALPVPTPPVVPLAPVAIEAQDTLSQHSECLDMVAEDHWQSNIPPFPSDIEDDRCFDTVKEAVRSINTALIDRGHGCTVSIASSKDRYAYLVCWRSKNNGRDPKSTVKVACPWRATLRRDVKVAGQIEDRSADVWRISTVHDVHNHDLSPVSDIPGARRLLREAKMARIIDDISLGLPPRKIKRRLRNMNIPIATHDMRNVLTTVRARQLQGYTATEAALRSLEESSDIWYPWYEGATLSGLLFATETSRIMARRYPKVFMIDATYQTNVYGMPCCHIVGKTGFGEVFTAAVILMRNEDEEWYTKALRAFRRMVLLDVAPETIITDRHLGLSLGLRAIFPESHHLFCQFHIHKNIAENCKLGLSNDEYDEYLKAWNKAVMYQDNLCDLQPAMVSLRRRFNHARYCNILEYTLEDLAPVYPKFVACYVNKYRHHGLMTTSPCEGKHATLKLDLNRGRLGFDKFIERVRGHFKDEYRDFLQTIATHRPKHVKTKASMLAIYSRTLTPLARKLLDSQAVKLEEYLKAEQEELDGGPEAIMEPCRGYYRTAMALDCAHSMEASYEASNNHLHLNPDPMWRLPKEDELEHLRVDAKRVDTERGPIETSADLENLPVAVLNPYRARAPPAYLRRVGAMDTRVRSRFENIEEQALAKSQGILEAAGAPSSQRSRAGVRRCTICRGTCHNRTTCPQRHLATAAGPSRPHRHARREEVDVETEVIVVDD